MSTTASALPIIPANADTRTIAERASALIRERNLERSSRTVAQLAGIEATLGVRTFVTDANATTFRSIVAGGGANLVPVYYDDVAAAWRIG